MKCTSSVPRARLIALFSVLPQSIPPLLFSPFSSSTSTLPWPSPVISGSVWWADNWLWFPGTALSSTSCSFQAALRPTLGKPTNLGSYRPAGVLQTSSAWATWWSHWSTSCTSTPSPPTPTPRTQVGSETLTQPHTYTHSLTQPHTYTHSLTHTTTHIHTHSLTHIHTHSLTQPHTCTHALTHSITHTHTHVWLNMAQRVAQHTRNTDTQVGLKIHTDTHTHTQTHTLTYTHRGIKGHISLMLCWFGRGVSSVCTSMHLTCVRTTPLYQYRPTLYQNHPTVPVPPHSVPEPQMVLLIPVCG